VNDTAYADFYGPATVENAWDTTGRKPPVSPEYMNDWLMRNIELVDKYHPQLFWFDWWIEQKEMEPYRKSFAAYYYNKGLEWKKGVVLNYKNKSYPDNAAVLDLERGKLGGTREPAWQTDDAIGNQSWGYAKGNTFKSVQYVVTNLIDIVSKNGNLLLNIGPKPDGTITDEETAILLGVGKWLDVNGEAIYATRPWKIFGEGPTQSASGSFADQKQPFTAKDIRFTTKGKTLYAIAMGIPKEPLEIKSLSSSSANGKIRSIQLVGTSTILKWTQTPDALIIQPASKYPMENAVVYKISF
jgi:alpha-L-fucosidase